GALVHVAVVVDLLHHLLDAALVLRVARADEEVVGGVDAGDQVAELHRVAIGQLARRHTLALGGLRDRLAVLVGAGEEEHVLPALAHVAREYVGGNSRVRVPRWGPSVPVVDRLSDVEGHARPRLLVAAGAAPAQPVRARAGEPGPNRPA